MDILFLDVDGVLNYVGSEDKEDNILDEDRGFFKLSADKLKMLADLKRELEFEIVLSSTWRKYPNAHVFLGRQLWHRENILLHGMTPNLPEDSVKTFRIDAIKMWLEETTDDVGKYVIVDDSPVSKGPVDNFVHVDYRTGLRECDCDAIRKILKRSALPIRENKK